MGLESSVYPHVLSRVLADGTFDLRVDPGRVSFLISSGKGLNNREQFKLVAGIIRQPVLGQHQNGGVVELYHSSGCRDGRSRYTKKGGINRLLAAEILIRGIPDDVVFPECPDYTANVGAFNGLSEIA